MLDVYTNFALKVDFVNGKSFYPISPDHIKYCLGDEIFSYYVMRMKRYILVAKTEDVIPENLNIYLASKARAQNEWFDEEDQEIKRDDTFGLILKQNNKDYIIGQNDMPAVVFHYGHKKHLVSSRGVDIASPFVTKTDDIKSYFETSFGDAPAARSVEQKEQEQYIRSLSFKNMETILERHPYKEPLLIDLHQINKGKDITRFIYN